MLSMYGLPEILVGLCFYGFRKCSYSRILKSCPAEFISQSYRLRLKFQRKHGNVDSLWTYLFQEYQDIKTKHVLPREDDRCCSLQLFFTLVLQFRKLVLTSSQVLVKVLPCFYSYPIIYVHLKRNTFVSTFSWLVEVIAPNLKVP